MNPLDRKTLEALADLICGDEGPCYRKGWVLPIFFRSAGLECPDHDGSTRKWWTLERLSVYNETPTGVRQVILRLADPREYVATPEATDQVIDKLNQILSIEGLKVTLDGVKPRLGDISPTIPEVKPKTELYAIPVPDFGKLTGDTTLSEILAARWKEVVRCIECRAHLGAIILMGSILEGVLLAIVVQRPKEANQAASAPKDKSGKVKRFDEWTLNSLINVCHDCNWIQMDAKKFSHSLREYRNLVHPWEQRALKEDPDDDTCRICWEVIRAAINDIEKALLEKI